MSFTGAINAGIRRWLGNVAHCFTDRDILIGCSGNFTLEQIITRYSRPASLWGNDVSLYSSVLGAFLSNQEFALIINDDRIDFVKDYLDSIEDKAATILLMSEIIKHEKEKNLYQTRLWNHYRTHFASYHQSTREKLKRYKENIHLDRYTSKDIFALLKETPPKTIVIAYLPTYAGGYEKLYQRMEDLFTWNRPKYKIIDEKRKLEIVKSVKNFEYIYIDDQKNDEMPLAALTEKGGYKTVYLHSNITFSKKSFIQNKINFNKSNFERLTDDHEITRTSIVHIQPTSNNIINYFRNLFLKKGIDYVKGDCCFLVSVDKKLFGFLIFSLSRFEIADIYLLSDFVVQSRYKRLSKLLLMVSKSDWIRQYLEMKYLKKVSTILTTAFTEKPVSMKYRGVYQLQSRKEGRLNYIAEAGSIKLEEVVPLWLKKYEKK